MDYKLNWTLRARTDLREIVAYIAKDNPAAALGWGEGLFKHAEVLTTFPTIGPTIPQAAYSGTRRIVYGRYLVFYRVKTEAKAIDVITVWHAARGLPDFL